MKLSRVRSSSLSLVDVYQSVLTIMVQLIRTFYAFIETCIFITRRRHRCLSVVSVVRRADPSSRGVLPTAVV